MLEGLKAGSGSEMVDGAKFYGAKAYKDAKALNMMTVSHGLQICLLDALPSLPAWLGNCALPPIRASVHRRSACHRRSPSHLPVISRPQVLELHRRLHDSSGIVFNSMYPG